MVRLKEGLENITKKGFEFVKKNKHFLLGSALLIGASFLDGYLTLQGMEKGILMEANPVQRYCMNMFGSALGCYSLKGVAAAGAIVTSYFINKKKAFKGKLKGHHILYGGALAYGLASAVMLSHLEFTMRSNLILHNSIDTAAYMVNYLFL